MSYEEISDFDINVRIAEMFGIYWNINPDRSESGRWEYCKNDKICNDHAGDLTVPLPDFCNNPSDAMPIMIEMKIGFKWVNGGCTASSVMCGYHEYTSDNPLRAAMIVFLMMRDEQCQKK